MQSHVVPKKTIVCTLNKETRKRNYENMLPHVKTAEIV